MSTQMIPVTSSMFASLGYNPETAELFAQFHTGTLGAYSPTSKDEFDTVLTHPDGIGKTFNKVIKPTKKYRKVEVENEVPKPISLVEPANIPLGPVGEVARVTSVDVGFQEIEVAQEAAELARRASTFRIITPEAHMLGQELAISIANTEKRVQEFFAPMKTAAYATHKAICARENENLAPLTAAKNALTVQIKAFERKVAQDTAAAQEVLRLETVARAEREAKEESERLAIEDAIALEAAGDIKGAEAVLANPVPVQARYMPPPIVASPISRVVGAGRLLREKNWRAVVTDINLVPREWLIVDQVALNKHAASRKGLAVVPGVRFEPAE